MDNIMALKVRTCGEFDGDTADLLNILLNKSAIQVLLDRIEKAEAESQADSQFYKLEYWDYSPEFQSWDYDSEDEAYQNLIQQVEKEEMVVCLESPAGNPVSIDVPIMNVTVEGVFWSGMIKNTCTKVESLTISKESLIEILARIDAEEPRDHSDDVCPCGDVDCSRPFGHA